MLKLFFLNNMFLEYIYIYIYILKNQFLKNNKFYKRNYGRKYLK